MSKSTMSARQMEKRDIVKLRYWEGGERAGPELQILIETCCCIACLLFGVI